MNQSEKSILFAQMHRKGQPLLLYNMGCRQRFGSGLD